MKTIDEMAEEVGLRSDKSGLFWRSGGMDGVTGEDLVAFAAIARAEPTRTLPADFVASGLALAKGALYLGQPIGGLSRDELIALAAFALLPVDHSAGKA